MTGNLAMVNNEKISSRPSGLATSRQDMLEILRKSWARGMWTVPPGSILEEMCDSGHWVGYRLPQLVVVRRRRQGLSLKR